MMQGYFYAKNNKRVPGLRDFAPNGFIKSIKPDGTVTIQPDYIPKYKFCHVGIMKVKRQL